MPIRVMNWNIQELSQAKVLIPGVAAALGQIIADAQPDIVVLVEPQPVTGIAAIVAVALAAGAASVAAGGNANDYTGWLVSYPTGGERYGFLVRDLNLVRPIVVAAGPAGSVGNYIENLDLNTFSTWPGTFAAMANAYAAPLPPAAGRPQLPLTEVYAAAPPAGRKRKRFGGQTIRAGAAAGGYALGIGFRMPCLAMFNIPSPGGGAPYLLPIVACHFASVRGGPNPLGRKQTGDLRWLHIAQKFSIGGAVNATGPLLPNAGYIVLDAAAVAVQDLIITGDFNVDFMQNTPGAGLAGGNNRALSTLTPTLQAGGSAAPAAQPAAPGVAPGAVPFVVPLATTVPLVTTFIPNLALRAALTATGSMLVNYNAAVVPANVAALRGACFDNFFYGGAALAGGAPQHAQILAAPDAALTYDIPSNIVNGAAPTGANAYNVSGAWTFHAGRVPPTQNAAAAPNT